MQHERILLVVTAYMYKWCLVHSGGNFLPQIAADETHLPLNLSYTKGGQLEFVSSTVMFFSYIKWLPLKTPIPSFLVVKTLNLMVRFVAVTTGIGLL